MVPAILALYSSLAGTDERTAGAACGLMAVAAPVIAVLCIVHGRLVYPVYGIRIGTPDVAALVIAQPTLPIASNVRTRVEPIARAIQPLLEPAHHDALRGHFLRFLEEGGRTNLQRWTSAVDKTHARVGLALCQDLPTAARLLEPEEGARGPLTRDLIAFATSGRFLRLRKQLGIAVG